MLSTRLLKYCNVNRKIHPLVRWTLWGWLIGLAMAAIIFLAGHYLPGKGDGRHVSNTQMIAVILAWMTRIVVTRTSDMMAARRLISALSGKPVPTEGSWRSDWPYCLYLLLCYLSLVFLPYPQAAVTIFAAVPFARMVACQMVLMLPYRGNAAEAPQRYSTAQGLLLFVLGMTPLVFMLWLSPWLWGHRLDWSWLVFPPCVVMYALYLLMARRLRGFTYNGMTCVAAVVELAFLLTTLLVSLAAN